MLTKFTVSNFKGFNDDFVFDFKDINGYTFNKESIKNGIVNNALIYGKNGTGKSNLGFAIFDIISHLTDKYYSEEHYEYYLNAKNNSETAYFEYHFQFGSNEVKYQYKKTDAKTILYEKFSINDTVLAYIDKTKSVNAEIALKGAESLKSSIPDDKLSLLKYIKSNSVLDENEENKCLSDFFDFVDKMLFFRSLHENTFVGIEIGANNIGEDIVKRGNIKKLEAFLNKAEIECKLSIVQESGKETVGFDFNGNIIPYYKIASSGTRALVLFYYWMQKFENVSFLFIDEFDAFYHHELSVLVIEELKKMGVQFVITTHNTSIMSNDLLRPDCYFLMNQTEIKPLSKCTSKDLREAHNLEKMYKANSFNVQ